MRLETRHLAAMRFVIGAAVAASLVVINLSGASGTDNVQQRGFAAAAEETPVWSGSVTSVREWGRNHTDTDADGESSWITTCRDSTTFQIVGPAGDGDPNHVLMRFNASMSCSETNTSHSAGFATWTPNSPCNGAYRSDTLYTRSEEGSASGIAAFAVHVNVGEGTWYAGIQPVDYGALPKVTTSWAWQRHSSSSNLTSPCLQWSDDDSDFGEIDYPYDVSPYTYNGFTPTDPDRVDVVNTELWTADPVWGSYDRPTVTINLTRKPLRITDAEIQRQALGGGAWESAQAGLVDGTPGRVHVEVGTVGQAQSGVTVEVVDRESDAVLFSATGLDVTAQLPLDFAFDTTDLSFTADGAPRTSLELEVRLVEEAGSTRREADSRVLSVPLMPKPVMLVHGLWSDASTWDAYPGFLRSVHPNWIGHAVTGMRTGTLSVSDFTTETNSIAQNASILAQQVAETRVEHDAWQVDVVAHSMGGLITRKYITSMPMTPTNRPAVDHLVMLGTPNRGSPCAELVAGVQSYVDDSPITSIVELLPHVVAGFNQLNSSIRGVKASIYAGEVIAPTCQSSEIGDLVVPVSSAFHTWTDRVKGSTLHTDMPPDRGLFDDFVLPRLVAGRAVFPALPPLATGSALRASSPARADADPDGVPAAGPAAEEPIPAAPAVIHTSSVTVPANRVAKDVTFGVPAGDALGVMVATPSGVALTLTRPDGSVAFTQNPTDPAAAEPMRWARVPTPATGTWRLRLQSLSGEAAPALVSVWVEGAAVQVQPVADLDAATITSGGTSVPLRVTATRNGSPLTGQSVTAVLDGHGVRRTLTLADDGAHDDGPAGDGVYGAALVDLPDGVYWLGARLTADGVETLGQTAFTLGDEPMPRTDPFPVVAATAPTWNDPPGHAADTYTISAVPGHVFQVGGTTTPPGTYPVDPDDPEVRITVTAAPGYILTGRTRFLHVFADLVEFTTAPVPTITGAAAAGQTLTAHPGSWAPTPDQLTYQWLRDDDPIPGATNPSYGITAADVGARIAVEVTATRTDYWTSTRTSAGTAPVTSGLSSLTAGSPTVAGALRVGSTLTSTTGTWGPAPVTLTRQWLRNGAAVAGATAATYRLTTADVGARIALRVTGTRPGYAAKTSVSTATGTVLGTITTAAPRITGTPRLGRRLTAVPGQWGPAAIRLQYQWLRSGKPIRGATTSTYRPGRLDRGKKISVRVTGTRTNYVTASRTSTAVGPVRR